MFAENKKMRIYKVFILVIILFSLFSLSGCGAAGSIFDNVSSVIGINDSGTVISSRANIRSSYAVVAADLLEVKRGEKVDILEDIDFEKVRWFRVRANDDDATEGWIEAQHIITGSLLEKSKNLAIEDKDLQPQAKAQLKAASNLRLSPEQKDDNLLFKLPNGSTFDIVGWRYVPKTQVENAN